MSSFKDLPASQGWIHELARGDMHPDADRILQLGRSFDPQQRIEESTIEFLGALREQMTEYTRTFNALSDKGSKFQEVKIFGVAGTAADFMLYRNQMKLTISNAAHGVIQLAFAQHQHSTLNVNGGLSGGNPQLSQNISNQAVVLQNGHAQELLAQIGPFRDVQWTFQGDRVEAPRIAQFYFAEFVRATREAKKGKLNNQVLLDQIKQLLQEKGLEL